MPSSVMLPFIQCHHTRGRAPAGGFSNPLLSESTRFVFGLAAVDCPGALAEAGNNRINAQKVDSRIRPDRPWSLVIFASWQRSGFRPACHFSAESAGSQTRFFGAP